MLLFAQTKLTFRTVPDGSSNTKSSSTDSGTMGKNTKKAKKNKGKAPPTGAEQHSEQINEMTSNGRSEQFNEEISSQVGPSQNREDMDTSTEKLRTNTEKEDSLQMEPESPESNPEELLQLKNRCSSMKSNLKTMTKKYEDEKKQREELNEENKYLKSKLSDLEKELEAAKIEMEKLRKGGTHPRTSFEDCEVTSMEVDPTTDVCEQPEEKGSDDLTWEEKEQIIVQNNTQGLAQGNEQDKMSQRSYSKATACDGPTEASISYQPSAHVASGSETSCPNKRSNSRQNVNEWPHKNEQHAPHHLSHGRVNREEERGMDGRQHSSQDYNHDVRNCNRFDSRSRTSDEQPVVTEVFGDLFTAPPDWSLAHCVAEDMRMGSGIAVTFKQMFKRVGELLDQRKRQGDVAVLEDRGRFIYYLVTKPESTGKPTMDTLERSLKAMCEHVIKNQVTKIAMPRIGCGLDRLEWRRVKPIIETIFSRTGAQINIYNYAEDVAESSKPKPTSNVWLKNTEKPVAYIDRETAILCLCAADGLVDSTFELLDSKFRIMTQFQKMDKKLGQILHIPEPKPYYHIFLLIVKKRKISPISFMALEECMRQACKLIEKLHYYYVAVEGFDDIDEPLLFEKVVTVIKTCLDTKQKKELWICWPKTVTRKYNTWPNSEM